MSFFPVTNVARATTLAESLRGYILLQVEEKGEAWYVNMNDFRRYYLQNGQIAYVVLREFGLGITNDDLEKIPVGIKELDDQVDSDNDSLADRLEEALGTNPLSPDSDGDGYTDGVEVKNSYQPLGPGKQTIDLSLASRLKGQILLQVQSKGQAWYINPADSKRYYLKDGLAAYEIMRFLSLGITNKNLEQIPTGVLNFTIDTPTPAPVPVTESPQSNNEPTVNPAGAYQWVGPHQTTQAEAITKIDAYLDELINQNFSGVELSNKQSSWSGNVLSFSFTIKKLFISAQIKGQVVVTNNEVKLGLDFPEIITVFVTKEKVDAIVQEKVNELFQID
ncbi:MAG: polyhydroxyalkanoic acid system family protein [Candidatus Buchananbacteria bacterium]|nr:polyhydroxyalkanoic acid system family protein [Candidatus Buchananbacteria bacterium]